VGFGDVVDEFENDDGFADAGAAEGSGFAAMMKGQIRSMTSRPASRSST